MKIKSQYSVNPYIISEVTSQTQEQILVSMAVEAQLELQQKRTRTF
jgi:hypothetical protein